MHFENLAVTSGSVETTTPATIAADTTTINFEVKLEEPGDFYEFEVDMVNGGTIDAMISDYKIEGITEE